MNLISIDLENNQPSGTIIQVGWTIFNVKTGKILVKSYYNVHTDEIIDPYITNLTGITQEMITCRPQTLEYVYTKMLKDIERYQTSKHVIQWGTDHQELREQLGIKWQYYTFSRRAIDVKALYQSWCMSRPQCKTVAGLGKALSVLGMVFEGEQHRAHDDAYNTVRVYLALLDKWRKYEAIVKIMGTK